MEFMNETVLSQIENNILKLPVDDQLQLISRVAKKLRKKINIESDFESQLSEMAKDTEIQNELREIELDFRQTEFDGLAK